MSVSLLTIELTEFALRVGQAEARGRGFHFHSLEEIPLTDGERIESILNSLASSSASAVAVSVQPSNKVVQFVTLDQLSAMGSEQDLYKFLQENSGIEEEAIMAAVDAERGKPYSFEGVKELNALTALFPRKNLLNAKAFLGDFGLRPSSLQPASLLHVGSLLQYLNFQKENEPVMMLEIGEELSHVAFVSLYGVTNMVQLPSGLADMWEATRRELSLESRETAQDLFFKGGDELLEIEQTFLKNFLEALNPQLELFETQTGILPSYVVTAGLPKNQSWLAQAISREINTKPLEIDFSGWLGTLEMTAEKSAEPLLHNESSLGLFHLLRAHRSGKPEFMWQLNFNRYLDDESTAADSKDAPKGFKDVGLPTEDSASAQKTEASGESAKKSGLKLKTGDSTQKGTEAKPGAESSEQGVSSSGLRLSLGAQKRDEEKLEDSVEKGDEGSKKPSLSLAKKAEDAGGKPDQVTDGKEAPKEGFTGDNEKVPTPIPEKPKETLGEKVKEKPPEADAVLQGKPRPDPSKRKEAFAPPPEIAGKKKEPAGDEAAKAEKEKAKDLPKKKFPVLLLLASIVVLVGLGGFYVWWQSDRHLADLPSLSSSPAWNGVSPENAKVSGLAWVRPDDNAILLTAYPQGLSAEIIDRAFLSYRNWSGNFSVLGNLEEVTSGAQGGLLVRSVDARRTGAFLFRDGNEIIFRVRGEDGVIENVATIEVVVPSLWLRIDRRGSSIVGFVSYDGEEWERIGQASIGSGSVQGGWALAPDSAEAESVARITKIRAGDF